MATKDGGPAFIPVSLRDYFAAAALGHIPKLIEANNGNLAVYNIAEWAYEVADGMLRERERGTK